MRKVQNLYCEQTVDLSPTTLLGDFGAFRKVLFTSVLWRVASFNQRCERLKEYSDILPDWLDHSPRPIEMLWAIMK
jgi:hypothetical protein